jgi:hypothetical protein
MTVMTDSEILKNLCERVLRLEQTLYTSPQAPISQEPVVYQCPRCATSLQIDPTAKPSPQAQPDLQDALEKAACTVWSGLMDYCKANRINPARENSLFEIVNKIRAMKAN